MSFILRALRNGLGAIIAFLDIISRPKKMRRSQEEQIKVNEQAKNLSLYQFFACPFCIKTRRALHRLNVPVNYKSIKQGSVHRQELQSQGGKIQAPCLKIESPDGDTWLYESSAIIAYLNENFSAQNK